MTRSEPKNVRFAEKMSLINENGAAAARADVTRRRAVLVAAGVVGAIAVSVVATQLIPDRPQPRGVSAPPPATIAPSGPSAPSEPAPSPTVGASVTAPPPVAPAPSPAPTRAKDPVIRPPVSPPAARPPAPPPGLATGQYKIRPAHTANLCLGEGRERNGRTTRPLAVQVSCASVQPAMHVEVLGNGEILLKWHKPEYTNGVGCLSVDDAGHSEEHLVAPRVCDGTPSKRFRPELISGSTYRLRPAHSNMCLGILYGDAVAGAEAAQYNCTNAPSQAFILERA